MRATHYGWPSLAEPFPVQGMPQNPNAYLDALITHMRPPIGCTTSQPHLNIRLIKAGLNKGAIVAERADVSLQICCIMST